MLWILLLAVVVIFIYKKFSYWNRRGIYQHSVWVQCETFVDSLLQVKPVPDAFRERYNSFQDRRYAGIYFFFRPSLLIRDPELIYQISVKDFEHFTDRNQGISTQNEPLWEKTVLVLKGNRWKTTRKILSQFFTSSNLKSVFELVTKTAEEFTKYFQNSAPRNGIIEFEAKDAFSRFASDAIASTAFGFTCNSLKDRDNKFYLMGKKATNFAGRRFVLLLAFPKLAKLLGVRLFSKEIEQFFGHLVKTILEKRRRENFARSDLIQIMLQAQTEEILNDEEIVSQAFTFLLAGVDTVSTTMCFMAYELATNPEIQTKLQLEINETLAKCDGNLTYDALMKMTYMDMVVSEVIRKWPSTTAVNRKCTKPYTIHPVHSGESPIRINVGDAVILPFYAIHRDHKYYPEPERFDPERFGETNNKEAIKSRAYLPFGSGPRGCLGSRLALVEVKLIFFELLAKFKLVVLDKTEVPPKLGRNRFNLSLANGLWLGLKPKIL